MIQVTLLDVLLLNFIQVSFSWLVGDVLGSSPLGSFACGYIRILVSCIVVTPLGVIMVRLAVQGSQSDAAEFDIPAFEAVVNLRDEAEEDYKGANDCFQKICGEEGWLVLYRAARCQTPRMAIYLSK
ncbi:hypothetical protein B0H14DRAFT_3440981 [Mycena olivaceomarginata]|nr:hypothetical protein B0H14DRAFT_3440981 [Mycena olivaceomarginata]